MEPSTPIFFTLYLDYCKKVIIHLIPHNCVWLFIVPIPGHIAVLGWFTIHRGHTSHIAKENNLGYEVAMFYILLDCNHSGHVEVIPYILQNGYHFGESQIMFYSLCHWNYLRLMKVMLYILHNRSHKTLLGNNLHVTELKSFRTCRPNTIHSILTTIITFTLQLTLCLENIISKMVPLVYMVWADTCPVACALLWACYRPHMVPMPPNLWTQKPVLHPPPAGASSWEAAVLSYGTRASQTKSL